MDALTSLDRTVVWRFEPPLRADFDRFRARVVADLAASKPAPPVRPFVMVSPCGMRCVADLERALAVRGVVVVQKRVHEDWPRSSTALHQRSVDRDELMRAAAYEQVWRGLFPRAAGEQWLLDGDVSLERARAWKSALRQVVRGVQVTVQSVMTSFEAELHALHIPDSADLEREWRALSATRSA